MVDWVRFPLFRATLILHTHKFGLCAHYYCYFGNTCDLESAYEMPGCDKDAQDATVMPDSGVDRLWGAQRSTGHSVAIKWWDKGWLTGAFSSFGCWCWRSFGAGDFDIPMEKGNSLLSSFFLSFFLSCFACFCCVALLCILISETC